MTFRLNLVVKLNFKQHFVSIGFQWSEIIPQSSVESLILLTNAPSLILKKGSIKGEVGEENNRSR